MGLGAASFFALAAVPVDFAYPEVAVILFASGFGMGMFASPNAAAVMNSVPPENRGAASGMLATLQNTGQQMSLAIFFTVMIIGLSASLPGTVPGALGVAGVPSGDAGILGHAIAANPTGALFGAFLGENPMAQLLALASGLPGWTALPASAQAALLQPHFFASVVEPGFGSSISEAFIVAGMLTLVATVVSALRGQTYFYTATTTVPKGAVGPASLSETPRPPTPAPSASDVSAGGK
jgi:hypothetical protein